MKYEILDINSISQSDMDYVKAMLPLRYEKSLKFVNKDDQLRSIGAGILLLRNIKNLNEENICYNESGKPYLKEGPCFNISHSGKYVVIALDKNPVGVDIEEIDTHNLKYINKIFTQRETELINQNQIENFHILWTQKEAISKYFGIGLGMDFSSFEMTQINLNLTLSLFNQSVLIKTIKKDNFYISFVTKKE